jgi:hypothetical protein
MFRLVEAERLAVRQLESRERAPVLLADRFEEFDSLGPQPGDFRLDVGAHQIEFGVAAFPGRMDRQLAGRGGKEQPAMACVDRRKFENVAKESAKGLGLLAVEDGMDSADHILPPCG